MSFIVLDPTSGATSTTINIASRLATLDGKVLGIINNGKRNSDVFLEFLLSKIKEQYHLQEVIWINKENPSLPMTDSALQQLKAANAVIAGVGD